MIGESEERAKTRQPRRIHSPAFKVWGGSEKDPGDRFLDDWVALAAIRGEKTLAERFEVQPNQITQWRSQLLEGAFGDFGAVATAAAPIVDVKTLHAKIGALTLENDPWQGLRGPTGAISPCCDVRRARQGGSAAERMMMIDREHKLGLGRQAKALRIGRSGVHFLQRPISDADLALMRRTCELHRDHPFAGSRMLMGLLLGEGHSVGRLHVSTLMKKMAIAAL